MLVIKTAVQSTVNGVNLMNGEDAVKHVVKVSKREPEEWYSLRNLVESYAQGILQNPNLATSKSVQLIVNGVITAFGANAVKHVEEENRREPDTYKDQKSTEDWNVLGMLRKQGIVPKTIARFIVNGISLEVGVHAAKTVAADGKDDLERCNRKQLTVDYNVTDVQLKLELATLTTVHVTANGHLIQNGANAPSHAMEETKIEHESCNRLH